MDTNSQPDDQSAVVSQNDAVVATPVDQTQTTEAAASTDTVSSATPVADTVATPVDQTQTTEAVDVTPVEVVTETETSDSVDVDDSADMAAEETAIDIADTTESSSEEAVVESVIPSITVKRTQDITLDAIKSDIDNGLYLPPAKATETSSTYGVRARIRGTKFGGRMILRHNEIAIIPTGFSFTVPAGYVLRVCARPSLACKGILLVGSPSFIDDNYTEELKIAVQNFSGGDYVIEDAEHIAQLFFEKVEDSTLDIEE